MPSSNSKEVVVNKSNDLIQARYKLTVEEQRLIILLASMIHKDDEDFKSYELRVADFIALFGLEKRKSIYSELEESSKRLTGKTIELSEGNKKIYASWLSYVEYVEGSGVIRLEFHKSLKPYLLQLKDNMSGFTQYKLSTVMNFKSSYSIRLYELLKMEVWKAKKTNKKQFEKIFDIEEYRQTLGIGKKEYSIFANFRVRVIEPTIKEISDQTDLNIFEVRYIKTGRKITGLHFIVLIRSESETSAQAAQLQLGQTHKEKADIHTVIESLMNYGFTFEVAKNYKNKYGVKQIERNIAYMLGEDKKDPIHNKAGYLSKAIPQDWGNAIEQAETKKKELIAKQKTEEEQKRKEAEENERKKQEELVRNKERLQTFFSLPEGLQRVAKASFEQTIQDNSFVLDRWKKLETNGGSIENEPLLRGSFVKFLIENKMVE